MKIDVILIKLKCKINIVVPSLRAVPTSQNKFPKLLASEWVATNCTMIGDITAGKYSSFYHGVTLRGDTRRIVIGNKTVIQDNTTILNSELENPHAEVKIGDKVLIGVNCLIDNFTYYFFIVTKKAISN